MHHWQENGQTDIFQKLECTRYFEDCFTHSLACEIQTPESWSLRIFTNVGHDLHTRGVRGAIMNNPVLSDVQPLLRISLSLSLSLSLTLCIIRKLLASTGTSFANKRRYASGEELFICTVEGPSPSCLCTMGVLNCSEYLQFLVCGHADRSVSRVTLGLDLRVSHSVLRASSGYGYERLVQYRPGRPTRGRPGRPSGGGLERSG